MIDSRRYLIDAMEPVDLVQPFRLLFEPADTPIPRKNDGGIDLAQVTAVQITAIEDTHDPKNQRRGQ